MANKQVALNAHTRKFIISAVTLCLLLTAARLTVPLDAYALGNQYQWTRQDPLSLLGGSYTSVGSSADGSHLIVGVTGGGNGTDPSPLYVSSNYGATWQNVASNADSGIQDDWQSVAASSDGSTLVAASNDGININTTNDVGGNIFISHDSGTTWTKISPTGGPTEWNYVAISGDGSEIAAVAEDDLSNVYISNDGGVTWHASATTSTLNFWGSLSVSSNGSKILAGGENEGNFNSIIDLSTDGGNTWNDVTPDPTGNSQVVIVSRAALSSNGAELAVSTYGFNNISIYDAVHVSSDDGADWTDVTPPNTTSNQPNAIALSGNGQVLSVVDNTNDTMFTSNNDGVDWTQEDPDLAYNDVDTNSWNDALAISDNGSHSIVASAGYAYTGYNASHENNAATFVNASNGSPVVLVTPSGTNVTSNSIVSEASLSAPDSSYTYPLGLVDFSLNAVSPTDDITLTFVTNLTPSEVTLRSYNPTTKQYATVNGAIIVETTYQGQPALQVTYNLSETNLLDTNSNFDSISDPVGLALKVNAPNTGYGIQSNNKLAIIAPLSFLSLAAGLVIKRVLRKD